MSREFAAHLRGGPLDGQVKAVNGPVGEIKVPMIASLRTVRLDETEVAPYAGIHDGAYRIGKSMSHYSAEYNWDGFTCPYERPQKKVKDRFTRWALTQKSLDKIGALAGQLIKGAFGPQQYSAAILTVWIGWLEDVRKELREYDAK